MAMQAGDRGLVLRTFGDMWEFANCAVKAGITPKGLNKPEAVLVALQAGAEAGLTPMQSLANIAVINGRPSLWGDAVVALVRRSGLCEYIHESVSGTGEAIVATCKAKRKGEPEETVRSFSYKEAKTAALLSKDTYAHYPQRMIAMRARAWCLRDLFADVLCGLSVAEEMQDAQFAEIGGATIASGDDAPMDTLDEVTGLLGADDDKVIEAEYEAAHKADPNAPTAEELNDPEYQQAQQLF